MRPWVQIPPLGPYKDDYFDTMSIEIIVLAFLPKALIIADFLTLFEESTALARQKTGQEAVLFCFAVLR